VKKTGTISITKSGLAPACEISTGQSSHKHVDKFKYLETKQDGKCEQEIRFKNQSKYSISKRAFQQTSIYGPTLESVSYSDMYTLF